MSQQKVKKCVITKDEKQAIEARLLHLLANAKGWSLRRVMQAWGARKLSLDWSMEMLGRDGEFTWKLDDLEEEDMARTMKGYGLDLLN